MPSFPDFIQIITIIKIRKSNFPKYLAHINIDFGVKLHDSKMAACNPKCLAWFLKSSKKLDADWPLMMSHYDFFRQHQNKTKWNQPSANSAINTTDN